MHDGTRVVGNDREMNGLMSDEFGRHTYVFGFQEEFCLFWITGRKEDEVCLAFSGR